MDLFNAATMGVDPKTGTYLSKEQRVAMFRASRGQNGGGNGGGKTPKGGNANVKPQSALVVAEKMNGIVKSLSQNFKASTEGVKEQVNKNAQNIDDLYEFYKKDKEQEVKVEKKETRDQKLLAGRQLRKRREALIEGTARAAAAAARLGAKALDKMKKPVMGFLQKLGRALMFLGGAWLMKNLPAVLETFENFKNNVLDFKEKYFDSITDIRGVFSILDNILKGVKKTLSKIAKTALNLGGKLFRKAGDFAGKVTKAIGDFAKNVAKKIADALLNIWRKALNLIPKKPPVPVKPALPPASGGGRTGAALAKTSQRTGQLATGAAKGGNIFSGMGNWFKGVMGGSTSPGGAPTATGDLADASKGAKEAKHLGWLKKAMKPIERFFPGAMKLFGKFAKGALRTIPVLGFLIELALNRGVEGEPWIQAILSSLAGSTAGAVGAAAGAKAGFALGGTIGLPFGGVGAFIGAPVGAAIGGIVGGMLAGMTADHLVDTMFEGKAPSAVGTTGDALGSPTSSMDAALTPTKGEGDHSPLVNIPKIEGFSKGSTPSGMQEKVDTDAAFNGAQIIEMPPIMTDLRTVPDIDDKINTEIQQPPRISSADPDMDFYRMNSAKEYQMVVN